MKTNSERETRQMNKPTDGGKLISWLCEHCWQQRDCEDRDKDGCREIQNVKKYYTTETDKEGSDAWTH